MKYTDITSHEAACNYLKIESDLTEALKRYPEEERDKIKATLELLDIGNAINKITDFDADLNKDTFYIPYFTGSGFCFSGYDIWSSGSGVSSRLAYKSGEISDFVGKTFEQIYLKSRS